MLSLNAFEVLDGLAAGLMNHAEGDGAFASRSREQPDGDKNEGQAQIT